MLFYLHKCHYCDFYSLVETGPERRQPAFTDRLIEEIRAARPWLGGPLETIFVGGGTPTLLAPALWDRLLAAIRADLNLQPDCEFTVEANPDALSAELLEVLAAGGVNRLSMGAQSFDPALLKVLERTHDPDNVRRCVELARAAGITTFNLDLIFVIPGQLLEGWATDLDAVLALEPAHLSCYCLTYEPNTPLAVKLRRGAIQRVDEDVEAAMYEATIDRLAGAGFEHYEISSWARPGFRCAHNLPYWHCREYLGLGAGAHSYLDGTRFAAADTPGKYLSLVGEAWQEAERGDGKTQMRQVVSGEQITPELALADMLTLGLRLTEGIVLDDVRERTGIDAMERYGARLAEPMEAGLLENVDGRLRLTPRGRLLGNEVFALFLPD